DIIHWDFTVDKERRGSISVIPKDISYKELIRVVLEDFTIDNNIKFSYVSPSKSIFGTEDALPVFIRNDFQELSLVRLALNALQGVLLLLAYRSSLMDYALSQLIGKPTKTHFMNFKLEVEGQGGAVKGKHNFQEDWNCRKKEKTRLSQREREAKDSHCRRQAEQDDGRKASKSSCWRSFLPPITPSFCSSPRLPPQPQRSSDPHLKPPPETSPTLNC
ncbi:hypothetical protein HID58_019112, partial [Brassica napus]